MKFTFPLPLWTVLVPVLAWLSCVELALGWDGGYLLVVAVVLIGSVPAGRIPCRVRRALGKKAFWYLGAGPGRDHY